MDGHTGRLRDAGRLADLTAWPHERLHGADLLSLLDTPSVPALVAALGQVLDGPGAVRALRLRVRRGDGWWSDLPVLLRNDGSAANPSLVLLLEPGSDTPTPARHGGEVLSRQAFLRHVRTRLDEATGAAMVVVRLEDAATVGAALGSEAGQELLRQAVDRVRRNAPRGDDVVAILGPTIFAVLLEGLPDRMAGQETARLLQDVLCLPFALADTEVFAVPRVAVGLHGAGSDADGLLWATCAALDRSQPGHVPRVVEVEGRTEAARRLEQRRQLLHSIENDELVLHYQPVIELASGAVCGAEALIRWQHPEHGLLPPSAFLPLAEESRFIGALGRWVLREACREVASWTRRGASAPVTVAVNVSPIQLDDENLPDDVADALSLAGLPADRLLLEITETAILGQSPTVDRVFGRLRDLGVELAVDDFGTGHASLDRLRTVPASTIKIDRSFVNGFPARAHDRAIVTGTVSLVHSLGRVAVAEGVESATQLDALRELGCDRAQGYVVARPLSAPRFLDEFKAQVDACAGPELAGDSPLD